MNDLLKRFGLKGRRTAGVGGKGLSRAADGAQLIGVNAAGTFAQYEDAAPSAQNAVDLLPGWNMALPPACGVHAGDLQLFHDERMIWACRCFGSLDGARVLELGPLEAGHTIFLEGQGASVLGIEANKIAFLKCLVVKEIAGLTRARFLLGDFLRWLDLHEDRYDFIVASGVLYHMHDPLRLLELIARRSKAVYLWTHYVSDEAMPIGDPRRNIMSDKPEIADFHGIPVRLYTRTYNYAQTDSVFSGGMIDQHKWMHRDDILAALRVLGLTEIAVAHEYHGHQNGPCFSVFARAPAEEQAA